MMHKKNMERFEKFLDFVACLLFAMLLFLLLTGCKTKKHAIEESSEMIEMTDVSQNHTSFSDTSERILDSALSLDSFEITIEPVWMLDDDDSVDTFTPVFLGNKVTVKGRKAEIKTNVQENNVSNYDSSKSDSASMLTDITTCKKEDKEVASTAAETWNFIFMQLTIVVLIGGGVFLYKKLMRDDK